MTGRGRAKRFLRASWRKWEAFVYRDTLMPEELKDELATFFLALMTSFCVGSMILRFFVRH